MTTKLAMLKIPDCVFNWVVYFAKVLKSEEDVKNRETGGSPILKQEVEKAVRMLKNGKLPGADNITA